MKNLRFADITLRESAKQSEGGLSFREKIEIAKLLDRLNIPVIEVAPIENARIDSLLIKSIASSVKDSIVSVPVQLAEGAADIAWDAVSAAKRARLRVCVPTSPVQMEYAVGKKPDAIMKLSQELVAACAAKCEDVEFVAQDATRAESDFLYSIIRAAIAAGAKTVTLCDNAGNMMPSELQQFIAAVYENVPEMQNVTFAAQCGTELGMEVSCAATAIGCGAAEIKASVCVQGELSLDKIAQFVRTRGADYGVSSDIRITELKRIISQIERIMQSRRSKLSPFDSGVQEYDGEAVLSRHDDIAAVQTAVLKLGYDLSDEDMAKVFDGFSRIAVKKDVSLKELDAIVASAALQVPPTYEVLSYVVNSGNVITATSSIKLKRGEDEVFGVAAGDGPIDASFLAIEQITGTHYELDDFQIQAVTEGREAMGEAVIRLRSGGKLYSGRGISTDIIGASIRAYVSAVNKIVYEEA